MKPHTHSTYFPKWQLLSAMLFILFAVTGCMSTGAQGAGPRPSPSATPLATPVSRVTPSDLPVATPANPATAIATLSPTATLSATTTSSPTATRTPLSPTASPAATATPQSQPDLVAAGLEVFKAQYCGICHKLEAAHSAGIFGPDQNHLATNVAARLADPHYQGQATTPAEYIRESIIDPGIYYVPGFEQTRHHMPPYTHLSEAEIEALVQLLLLQK